MGTSEKIMHYANFNITYGPTEDPMLTHFEDIIWPAFLSDFKRGKKNEHPLFYLSDIALKEISGDMVLVGKEMLKTVTQIVSKVAEGHGVNSAVALSKAKNFLCENAEVSTTLSPTDLCQQIFSDSEEMQDEFLSLVQEEQIPDEIKIEKSFAIKASKSHRIKTDTGIEVIFPAEYFENHEFIEFVNNPNGTISIQLKNIGKIVNK